MIINLSSDVQGLCACMEKDTCTYRRAAPGSCIPAAVGRDTGAAADRGNTTRWANVSNNFGLTDIL